MSETKQCCANCIGDSHLRREVIPSKSQLSGTCSYCRSADQALVPPAVLRDYFELVLGIYVAAEPGRTLVEWLVDDWGMFDHPAMDAAHAKELLADILDDGEVVRKSFAPLAQGSESLIRWQAFREELMFKNRYFPKAIPDLSRLRGLVTYLISAPGDIAVQFYRARLQDGHAAYAVADMGAPPAELAASGRASPAGIPYLYLASDQRTAISELRPHTGDLVCVANVTVQPGLNLVDLRNPKKTISPFTFPDSGEVALLRKDAAFLAQLGDELSHPVRQKSAHIDYLPSQYLCEFIKDCGFDGVMYRSSVGDGVNVALFDPAKATLVDVVQHRVSRVVVELATSRA